MGNLLRMVGNTRKKHILLAALLVFVTIFSAIAPLNTNNARAAAPTEAQKSECYNKFNNKDIIVSRLSSADQTLFNSVCYGSTYCIYVGDGAEVGSKHVSCTNPNAPSEDASTRANTAETAPLVRAACGAAPAGEAAQAAYQQCANSVRTIYADCSKSGGSATSEIQVDAATTAKCATPRINALPQVGTKTVNQITTAIQQGRDERTRILDADTNATTEKECNERNQKEGEEGKWTWKDGKCIEGIGDNEVVCSGGALGWLICPLIDIMISATQSVAALLDTMLVLEPLNENTGNGGASGAGPIYKLWQGFLNVANIVLVVAFLFVIFSQATSVGLSSYGIKKMLPKIIAAAILMNLSFFICQVLVDLSNILGGSAAQLVQATTGTVSFGAAVTEQVSGIEKLFAGGIAIVIILFFFLIPVLLSFLTVFFVIAARFALIILLILVAPLAFAAWILPNTEQYFKKWWGLFFNLLMLYPIIMFVFAASIIASRAVAAVGQ